MYVDWIRFSSLIHRAIEQGATIAPPRVEWDVSLNCERPYQVILESFPHADWRPVQNYIDGSNSIRRIYLDTPCRKCPTCCLNRSRFWAKRAHYEVMRSQRTWMVTLTIAPEARFIFSLRAKTTDYRKSYNEISKEVTLMFKRMRKAGHKFRYICVAEAHKDGYPHIHLLIHEGLKPIPKREIQKQWSFGFTTVKLVENSRGAAKYVSKYLAKDMAARVRASQHYGHEVAVCDTHYSEEFFTFSNSPFIVNGRETN